jgi:hypothetical protein
MYGAVRAISSQCRRLEGAVASAQVGQVLMERHPIKAVHPFAHRAGSDRAGFRWTVIDGPLEEQ